MSLMNLIYNITVYTFNYCLLGHPLVVRRGLNLDYCWDGILVDSVYSISLYELYVNFQLAK